MLVDALMLLAGLVLRVKGGDPLVSSNVRIAEFPNWPRVAIDPTPVALTPPTP